MQLGRWEYGEVFSNDAFTDFWSVHLSKPRNLLFIMGAGFDPRMNHGLRVLLDLGGQGERIVDLLHWTTGNEGPHEREAQSNINDLKKLVAPRGALRYHSIDSPHTTVLTRKLVALYNAPEILGQVTDIVLDISALPRELFFPLLWKLLNNLEREVTNNGRIINLHVLVCEAPQLDSAIQQEGDQADFIFGFKAGFDEEAEVHIPRVWVPILGEGHEKRLEKCWDFIKPQEVSPVVPFPSGDPRRGDRLILEYRRQLDAWKVDPRDVMYVSEQNPFDVYRRLRRVNQHYRESLELLGGVRVAISALSSKLLSIGALLASYEDSLAVVHAGGLDYRLVGEQCPAEDWQLTTLWLSGEPYEQ